MREKCQEIKFNLQLGHVTCQAADDEIEIGEAGNEVPSKNEFPVWDDAQGEWPGVGDNVD